MCGITGYIATDKKHATRAKANIASLLVASSVRGDDATGIGFVDIKNKKNTLFTLKQPLTPLDFTGLKEVKTILTKQNPQVMIGHARAKTQGDEKNNVNNHPIFTKNGLALVHNGMISNDKELFDHYKLERDGEVDSEIIVKLIEYHVKKGKTVVQAIKKAVQDTTGSLACALIDIQKPDVLYLFTTYNPIVLAYQKSTGIIYFASTQDILNNALLEYKWYMDYFYESVSKKDYLYQEVEQDTLLRISPQGIKVYTLEQSAYYDKPYVKNNDTKRAKWTETYGMGNTIKKPPLQLTTTTPLPSEEIKKPSQHTDTVLEARVAYLEERKKVFLTKDERSELHRLYNALDNRASQWVQ